MAAAAPAHKIEARILEVCQRKLSDALKGAGWPADFAANLMAAVLAAHGNSIADFRARTLLLVANLPRMGPETATDFSFDELATVTESTLQSKGEAAAREKARHKRAREKMIKMKNDDSRVMCPGCNLPIKSRLNTNKFDLDDEELGTQFDNGYGNFCACSAYDDPTDAFGTDSDSSDAEGEVDGGAPPLAKGAAAAPK